MSGPPALDCKGRPPARESPQKPCKRRANCEHFTRNSAQKVRLYGKFQAACAPGAELFSQPFRKAGWLARCPPPRCATFQANMRANSQPFKRTFPPSAQPSGQTFSAFPGFQGRGTLRQAQGHPFRARVQEPLPTQAELGRGTQLSGQSRIRCRCRRRPRRWS
jgi:hypothetical protein